MEMTMYQAPEQLIALSKANLEAAVRFAEIALEGTERMLEVHLKAAKSAFADGVMQAKALAEVKDVEQLAQLKNALAQPNLEKANIYIKSVYDVAAATQSEIGKLLEEKIKQFSEMTQANVEAATAPAANPSKKKAA